jgi:hypothetical protein
MKTFNQVYKSGEPINTTLTQAHSVSALLLTEAKKTSVGSSQVGHNARLHPQQNAGKAEKVHLDRQFKASTQMRLINNIQLDTLVIQSVMGKLSESIDKVKKSFNMDVLMEDLSPDNPSRGAFVAMKELLSTATEVVSTSREGIRDLTQCNADSFTLQNNIYIDAVKERRRLWLENSRLRPDLQAEINSMPFGTPTMDSSSAPDLLGAEATKRVEEELASRKSTHDYNVDKVSLAAIKVLAGGPTQPNQNKRKRKQKKNPKAQMQQQVSCSSFNTQPATSHNKGRGRGRGGNIRGPVDVPVNKTPKRGSGFEGLGLPQPSLPVGGRLSYFRSFWNQNVSDDWAKEVIAKGYSIEFLDIPPFMIRPLVTTVPQDKEHIIHSEIEELLTKNAIEEVRPDSPGFYSRFFLVTKKDGGWRPVLNLKPLNQFLRYSKFTMETQDSIIKALRKGQWLATLDLKDAYLHVPILPAHRPYLRFAFEGRHYQFKVLPFGISTAPRVFTKVLAPIVNLIHQRGIIFHPYLDDCLLISESARQLSRNVSVAVDILQQAGFLVNWKKSFPEPSQDVQFLGIRILSIEGRILLPDNRVQDIVRCAQLFQAPRMLEARTFLRMLGLMTACLRVVPLARFQITKIMVPRSLIPHLEFWRDETRLSQGVSLGTLPHSAVVTTDACDTGWGGHYMHWRVQGRWTKKQRALHINCQELLAVHLTLSRFRHLLRNQRVLVRTDNVAVKQYINKQGGTVSPSLCALTLKLIQWCNQQHISLRAEHVPGVDNRLADTLSRKMLNQTEWMLKKSVVQTVFAVLGEPQIDLFATAENKQLPVFCSWMYQSEAFHIDAMTISWVGVHAYAFPPLALIPDVIRKASKESLSLILIAPYWPNRSWFPLILPLLIEDPIRLPLLPDLLTQQKGRVLHSNPGLWSLAAWKISGVPSFSKAYRNRLRTRSSPQGLCQHTKPMRQVGSIMTTGVGGQISIPLRQMYLKS